MCHGHRSTGVKKGMVIKVKAKTKRGLRIGIIWINRIAAVILAVCFVLFYLSSVMEIQGEKKVYHYKSTPLERRNTEFEESSLFTGILKDQIADITRMCVIRNQMETNGVYNGKKIIDISAFANRDDVVAYDNVTACYFLDDLIKWGNYGFDFETIGNRSELYDRYLTVEGKELESYASTNEEYKTLVKNLQITASELFQNYTEYTRYQNKYADGNTNIVFCYAFTDGGKVSYYTNSSVSFKGMSTDDLNAVFSKYNRFISYNPDKMQIATNTNLNAQNMRSILTQYAYSFQDNSHIWIGIQDQYENADILQQAYLAYKEPAAFFVIWLAGALISLVIFILSFVSLTKMEMTAEFEGKVENQAKRSRKLYLEIYVGFWIMAIGTLWFLAKEISPYLSGSAENEYTLAALIGGIVFLFHILFLQLYLCGIRKIRRGQLFRDSLLYLLVKKIKRGVIETYDNGSMVSRVWLPYLLFLTLNLVLVLWNFKGIILAFLLDMAIGAWLYTNVKERDKIIQGIEKIKSGDFIYKVPTDHLHGDNLILARSVNSIGASIHQAVETSMKDEKMKADLITNVSHDIKTPLTSIISYVDLIKRENITDEKIKGYIKVLDMKSQRLKQLADDLVEASKISSGNISIQYDRIDFVEFIHQVFGEFAEKFEGRNLTLIEDLPAVPVYIRVDSRHLFRVIENLYNNISKYALEGTRVYLTMEEWEEEETLKKKVAFSVKNISAQPLTVSAEELTERFVQGDESRRSEGSGLGLSIAKNLTKSMNGELLLQLDGDLFKAILIFDVMEE